MEQEECKRYGDDRIEVRFYPARCVHAGICTRDLPAVFDVLAHPWVDVTKGTVEEIAALIDRCPSGALEYTVRGAG
jgi:uncharacterized Fe-S cluster protein YjdI